MGIPWHTIGRFAVDVDGILFERYRRGWIYLGPVTEADAADEHDDAAALADLWADRFDARAPQTFRRE